MVFLLFFLLMWCGLFVEWICNFFVIGLSIVMWVICGGS